MYFCCNQQRRKSQFSLAWASWSTLPYIVSTERRHMCWPNVFIDLTSTPYTSPVRNLGVIFDKSLTFADHITKLSQICYMHIRDLRRLRPILDYKTACTIATSIVHSKLDYCNYLFYSINSSHIKRLQTIQNDLPAQSRKLPNIIT